MRPSASSASSVRHLLRGHLTSDAAAHLFPQAHTICVPIFAATVIIANRQGSGSALVSALTAVTWGSATDIAWISVPAQLFGVIGLPRTPSPPPTLAVLAIFASRHRSLHYLFRYGIRAAQGNFALVLRGQRQRKMERK